MLLVLIGGAAQGYGSLDEHEASASVEGACARCSSRLGHALGDPWTSCVVDDLLAEADAAKQAGRPYFPMVPHVFQPLAPKPGHAYRQAELFKNLLRNCTCNFDDGGSAPLRRRAPRHNSRPASGQRAHTARGVRAQRTCMQRACSAHGMHLATHHAMHYTYCTHVSLQPDLGHARHLQPDMGVPTGRPVRRRRPTALRALGRLPPRRPRSHRRLPRRYACIVMYSHV